MKSKLFMTIAMSAMVLAGCSSSSNAPAASSAAGSAAQSEAAAPTEQTKKDVYALGETAEADGVKITVNSERDTDQADDTFNTADKLEEGKTYAIIDATIENGTDEELNVSSVLNFELKDGDGRKADYELPLLNIYNYPIFPPIVTDIFPVRLEPVFQVCSGQIPVSSLF